VSKIESGRWSELLRRSLGMKGIEIVASELSPEVSPTWTIEDNAIEWGYLKSVRYASAGTIQGGATGKISTIRLRNPANSGVLVVIDQIAMGLGSIDYISVFFSPTVDQGQLAGTINCGTVDGRWKMRQPAAAMSHENAAAAGVFTLYYSRTASDAVILYDRQIVMPPKSSIDVTTASTNVTLSANFFWHERTISALEL